MKGVLDTLGDNWKVQLDVDASIRVSATCQTPLQLKVGPVLKSKNTSEMTPSLLEIERC
jgi:hypothetical protein